MSLPIRRYVVGTATIFAAHSRQNGDGLETKAAALMKQHHWTPMMRVVTEQPKPLIEVTRSTDVNRTRSAPRS